MKNHTALVTIYADASDTAEVVASALETVGRVSAVKSSEPAPSLQPCTCVVSYRVAIPASGETVRMELSDAECTHIRSVLERYGWRRTPAAKALGIDRSTLYRKMKRYRIAKDA